MCQNQRCMISFESDPQEHLSQGIGSKENRQK